MFYKDNTLRVVAGIAVVASLICARPATAEEGRAMRFGAPAVAPLGYLDFCDRQPGECGADPGAVRIAVRQAKDELAELAGLESTASTPRIATVGFAADAPRPPQIEPAADAPHAPPALDPSLWSLLNRVNRAINGAIKPQTDQATYGLADYWAEPLEDGRRAGDCEDYVLEKEHALVAAGVPREALSIAAVTTSWGESHAILLVSTTVGEFVLDNLDNQIAPWWATPYRWNKRQAPGRPFQWVMVEASPKTSDRR